MQTPEAKAIYRKRGQTVELRFADAKAHRGLRRFSGRGLERVRIEVGLCVLATQFLGCPGRRPAKSRRWTKWNVLPGRSLKAGRSPQGRGSSESMPYYTGRRTLLFCATLSRMVRDTELRRIRSRIRRRVQRSVSNPALRAPLRRVFRMLCHCAADNREGRPAWAGCEGLSAPRTDDRAVAWPIAERP